MSPPLQARGTRRVCGCCSLRAASVIIGATYSVGALALMFWRVTVAVDLLSDQDSVAQGEGVAVVCQALLLFAELVFSFLLVVGACVEKHVLVKAWFVFSVSAAVLAAAIAVVRAGVLGAEQGDPLTALAILAATTAALVVTGFSFVVVDNFHAELLRARHSRLLGL